MKKPKEVDKGEMKNEMKYKKIYKKPKNLSSLLMYEIYRDRMDLAIDQELYGKKEQGTNPN